MARIRNVEDPLLPQDVATMNYVQNYVGSAPAGFINASSVPATTNLNTTASKINIAYSSPYLVDFAASPGRLTYIGLRRNTFLVTYSVNFTTGSALTDTFLFGIYGNGAHASDLYQQITTLAALPGNWYYISGFLVETLDPGDYAEIFGKTLSISTNSFIGIGKLSATLA